MSTPHKYTNEYIAAVKAYTKIVVDETKIEGFDTKATYYVQNNKFSNKKLCLILSLDDCSQLDEAHVEYLDVSLHTDLYSHPNREVYTIKSTKYGIWDFYFG